MRSIPFKPVVLLALLLVICIAMLLVFTRGERSIDVGVEPYPRDQPYVIISPGESLVSLAQGGTLFLGFETDRHLRCVADSADPAVTGLRMRLFRLECSGPVLVARTPVVPVKGRPCFEHDVLDQPLGTEYLLRVTFHKTDGTTVVREESAVVEKTGVYPK